MWIFFAGIVLISGIHKQSFKGFFSCTVDFKAK